MELTLAIAVAALVMSALTLWRTELRGPKVAIRPVAGSLHVAIGRIEESDRVHYDVWREVLATNSGPKTALVTRVRVRTKGATDPSGKPATMDIADFHFGFVGEDKLEPERRNISIPPKHSETLTIGWTFTASQAADPETRRQIRSRRSPLQMELVSSSDEAWLLLRRSKRRSVVVRPRGPKPEHVTSIVAPATPGTTLPVPNVEDNEADLDDT